MTDSDGGLPDTGPPSPSPAVSPTNSPPESLPDAPPESLPDSLAGGRLVVVGDVVTDVLTLLTGPPRTGTDTAASVQLTGGGAGANTAAWFAAAGRSATLVCCVGDDDAGQRDVGELAELGVDVRADVAAGVPTGVVVVLVGTNGERTMFPDRGANDRLTTAHVRSVLADLSTTEPPVSWIHVSGYALLGDGSRAAGLFALRYGREHGIPTSVDVASAGPLAAVGAGTALSWTEDTDILLANADEAAVLTRGADPVRAASILAATRLAAVVKCGRDGAVWADASRTVTTGTRPEDAVDTTGAGDAFAAGLLAHLMDNSPAQLAPEDAESAHSGATPSEFWERDWPGSDRATGALAAGCAFGARAIVQPGGRPNRPHSQPAPADHFFPESPST